MTTGTSRPSHPNPGPNPGHWTQPDQNLGTQVLTLTLTRTRTLAPTHTLALVLTLTLALTLTLTLALTLTLTNPNQVLPPVQREALRTPRPRLRLVTRLVRRHALATARGGTQPPRALPELESTVRKQSPVFGALVKPC